MNPNRWLLLIAALAGGLGALRFGFALEWDLLNYHFYNPHALLTGRLAIDHVPAQLQTFLNPALNLPVYLVFKYLGPAALVFIVGAIQAGQLLLLLMILEQLTGERLTQRWMLLPVAALGALGPIFLNQLGGSQGDTLVSILVLGGFLTVSRELTRADGVMTVRAGMLAGVLLGAAMVLKLTMAIYVVSLGLSVLICFSGAKRWRMAFGLMLGGILGVAVAGGAWFIYLWQEYGNPLFPYFNNVFQSPLIESLDFRDIRFMPQSVAEWVFYPLTWWTDPLRVWEFKFHDIRMILVLAASFIFPVFAWRRMRKQQPALVLACLFIAISYLLWIRLFSIYRYLSVVEMLAPAVIFSCVLLITRSRPAILAALFALLATQALVQFHRQPPSWEFQPDMVTRLANLPEDAMVLIDSYEPLAFVALWMDDQVPLVRIRANFMRTTQPQHQLHEMAHSAVRRHSGPFYLLLSPQDRDAGFLEADLQNLGLVLASEADCAAVFAAESLQRKLGLEICPLESRPTGP